MSGKVNDPTRAVSALETLRKLPRTLMGGVVTMRAAGKAYLPQERAESQAAYDSRLSRSFLFNAFKKTVNDMAGKVFSVPIVLGGDMNENFVAYAENIDLAGRNLDTFAFEVMKDGMVDGISYILVDMSPAPRDAEGNPRIVTRAESASRRPWAVHVRAEQVLGWRSQERDGHDVLTQFRFMQTVDEYDGDFGEKTIPQVCVFNRDDSDNVTWQKWRKDSFEKWMLHEEGSVLFPAGITPEICVTPFYVNRTMFMGGSPLLSDLAEVNLEHWQSQSDQRNILHVARVPILFGAGIGETENLEIGASRMVTATEPTATLQYVEHSGAAIEAGRTDLKDLESQMQALGLELLMPLPGTQSATGEAIDHDKSNTPLGMIATSLQDSLEQMFGFMGMYAGLARDTEGGSLTVNRDFTVSVGMPNDGNLLLSAMDKGALSRKTFLRELQRRSILADNLDIDQEVIDAASDKLSDVEGANDAADAGQDTKPPEDLTKLPEAKTKLRMQ